MKPWTSGTLGPRSPGSLEPWNAGTLDLCNFPLLELRWNIGTLDLGTLELGTLEPWNLGTHEGLVEPCELRNFWNQGTLELWNFWNPGTLEACWQEPGTQEPWNHGALEPWNTGILELRIFWKLGTLEGWSRGTLANLEIIPLQGKKVAYYFGISLAVLDVLWLSQQQGLLGFNL